jgi:hypothetical protein
MSEPIAAFEIGCWVQPRGGGFVIGELMEFNADVTGALIHWNDGHEIWKALRNLEIVRPAPKGSAQ